MIGAILGDIAGSTYEFLGLKSVPQKLWKQDDFFTDDTVMTCMTAGALLPYREEPLWKIQARYMMFIKSALDMYPRAGWGVKFFRWAYSLPSIDKLRDISHEDFDKIKFNDSIGNGCAMKIAPVAYAADSLESVKLLSKAMTEVTHNTEEAIKYAEAVATTIYVALHTENKDKVKANILKYCPEIADIKSYEDLQASYSYSELAKDTVPAALYCFLISKDYDDAVAKAIGLGGDADTLAAITGSVAEAFYKYEGRINFIQALRKLEMYFKESDEVLSKLIASFYNIYRPESLIRG